MRLAVTVVSPATRQSTDVVLDADPATPMTVVAAELDRFARGEPPGPLPAAVPLYPAVPLYVDCQRIWQRLTLAEAPVRDGCVISLGRPDGCVAPSPTGLVDVLVAGGPDAGAIHRIGAGRADVGSGAGAAIRIDDPAMPSLALLVHVDDLGRCQVAAYPGTAASVDQTPLGGPARWLPGQWIAVGGTLLGLAPYARPDAGLCPSPDGAGLDFSRPPRPLSSSRASSSRADGGPAPVVTPAADRRLRPILMAGLPLVVGLALAFVLHQAYLLALAAVSPALLIGGALGERAGGWRRGRRSAPTDGSGSGSGSGSGNDDGSRPLAGIDRGAKAALDAQQAARREQCPDPATALGIASGPRRRLWERRRADPDYLLLRMGIADLPTTVELGGPEAGGRRRTVVRTVPDAVVTVPLAECGVLGVAGPGDCARAVGRWLVASAAIFHSPHDLRIYLLTDDSGRAGWEWVRWLPHCRPGSGGSCAAQLGNDAESVAARVAELRAIVAARRRVIDDGHRGVGSGPGIVVVLDGSRRLRSLPGVSRLLAEGPPVGVYAICLDRGERLLPAECQAVAALGRDGRLRVQQTTADTIGGVRADHADPGWCARVARSLAPIRDVGGGDEGDEGRRPAFAAGADRSSRPEPAARSLLRADVWVASVDWAALGRPEPEPEPEPVPGWSRRPRRAEPKVRL